MYHALHIAIEYYLTPLPNLRFGPPMGGNEFFIFALLKAGSASVAFSSFVFELDADKVEVEPKPPYPEERM